MPYFTTSLTTAVSSNPGVSTASNLNWMGDKITTASVYASTSGNSSGAFRVEYTLDDISLVKSSLVLWAGISSAWTGQGISNSSASVFIASGIDPQGAWSVTFFGPVGGLRLNSTSLTTGPLIFKVLQGEGG